MYYAVGGLVLCPRFTAFDLKSRSDKLSGLGRDFYLLFKANYVIKSALYASISAYKIPSW